MMVDRSVVIWELIVMVPNWSLSKRSNVSFLDTSDKMCNEDGASIVGGELSYTASADVVAPATSTELRIVGILGWQGEVGL